MTVLGVIRQVRLIRQVRQYSSTASQELKKTALYDFHVKQGGKMVEFAGWSMPVQYDSQGVLASHHWTREKASLFDVSHMLQTRWTGKDRIKFIESLVVGDVEGLEVGQSTLSLFTNKDGGIIDDTIINKQDDKGLYVVSNAGCREKDLKHVREQLDQAKGLDVDVQVLDASLVALQGPSAAGIIAKLSGSNLGDFRFMTGRQMRLKDIDAYVSRCGYTGEDGFEISVSHDSATDLCELLLSNSDVRLAGLAARDSLRLEAGLCLYGHDMDDTTTPVEAALAWTVGKRRRSDPSFLGAQIIIPQIGKATEKRRVGIIVEGAPAREGCAILSPDGHTIGVVTSGGPSPTLKKNIAMAYVAKGFYKQGTEVFVQVRNRKQPAQVVKMPFVPHQYV